MNIIPQIRSLSVIITAVFYCSLVTPLSARASDAVAIYVVDMQKVINDSVIGKAARANIDSEVQKAKTKIEALQVEFERQKDEFQKQASLLSKDAQEDKKVALIKKEKAFNREVQDQQEDLKRKNDQQMFKVLAEVEQVTKEIATQKNYKIIIERDPRLVVYSNPDFDVTEAVIKAVDARKL